MSWEHWKIAIVLAAAALFVVAVVGGCGSSALPAPLTTEQRTSAEEASFPVTVGVERDQYPVYSDALLEVLRESGLFTRVEPLEAAPDATLIAQVERRVYGTAVIPVFTAVSLGLVPTVVDEEHGYSFSLRTANGAGTKVLIDATYSGPTTLGWLAAVRNLSPDFARGDPKKTDRFRMFLRWVVAKNASEIERLPGLR